LNPTAITLNVLPRLGSLTQIGIEKGTIVAIFIG